MKFLLAGRWLVLLTVFLSGKASGLSDEPDIFAFFEEEAKAMQTVTASRLPLSVRQAPATVYVVTAEDIAAMGAQTLWDALRGVPGVDVMATRAFYGEVSIRGLNKSLNNRTLVLLDGRSVLNGPFDSAFWEGFPVAMMAIDRIEVVLGPASALYGANALNGVINIITKTSEQINGGHMAYSVGERRTHLFSAALGDRRGKTGFLFGGDRRVTDQFENADLRASDVHKVQGQVNYDVSNDTRLNLSGALADYRTQFAFGVSKGYFDGATRFLRADLRHRGTRVRAFWNYERSDILDVDTPVIPKVRLNTRELMVEQTLFRRDQTDMVIGGSVRHADVTSSVYAPNDICQTLWAMFYEHAWRPNDHWTLVNSVRLDRHTLTGWQLSPRGSLVFSPNPQHVFRLSAGAAFRNPTFTESHTTIVQRVSIPLGATTVPAEFQVLGDPDLKPERIRQVEVGHTGQFGRVKTNVSGFHYRFLDMIGVGKFALAPEFLPTFRAQAKYGNISDVARAWGGEVGAELDLGHGLRVFANTSYQRIRGVFEFQVSDNGGPVHKLNLGVQFKQGGWMSSLWMYRVGDTAWSDANALSLEAGYTPLAGYTLVNGSIGYTFRKGLPGATVRLDAFNALNHTHSEILPARSDTEPGLSGEVMRRRLTVTLDYRF